MSNVLVFPTQTIGQLCERVGAESATIHYKRSRGYVVAFHLPGNQSHFSVNDDLQLAVTEALAKCSEKRRDQN